MAFLLAYRSRNVALADGVSWTCSLRLLFQVGKSARQSCAECALLILEGVLEWWRRDCRQIMGCRPCVLFLGLGPGIAMTIPSHNGTVFPVVHLHCRSIYKGLIRFDLVRSSAPVYTVLTNGDEMIPVIIIYKYKIGLAC